MISLLNVLVPRLLLMLRLPEFTSNLDLETFVGFTHIPGTGAS
jgi:hypothetical protein